MRPYTQLTLDQQKVVLQLLLNSDQTTSEIARALTWARNTAGQRIRELKTFGWAESMPSADLHARGRPSTRIRLRGSSGCIAAIVVATNLVEVALVTLLGEVRSQARITVEPSATAETVSRLVSVSVSRLVETSGIAPTSAVLGLGSPIDESGSSVNPIRKYGWLGDEARRAFAAQLGMPVLVENNSNLAALGLSELDSESEAIVFVSIDEEIDAGTITHGHLHRGVSGYAGLIGHSPISAADDALCPCGNRGCLRLISSVPAIVRRMQIRGLDVNGLDQLERIVLAGNAVAISELRSVGRDIGSVLVGVTTMLAPNRVVLGGRVAELGGYLLAGAREVLYSTAVPALTRQLRVEAVGGAAQYAITGAAALAQEQMFGVPVSAFRWRSAAQARRFI